MYKNMLIPTDGSALSEKAIATAIELANAINAKVTGLHVTPRLAPREILENYKVSEEMWSASDAKKAQESMDHVDELHRVLARKYLATIEKMADEAGVPYEGVDLEHDSPAHGIIKVAEESGCDLIFMAAHGKTGIPSALLGSVTKKVLGHTNVPVLVHPST